MSKVLIAAVVVILTLTAYSDPDPDFESLEKVHAVWDPLAPDNYTAGVLVAECVMKAPPEIIWRVLTEDLDRWSEFVPDMLYSRVVGRVAAEKILGNSTSFQKVRESAEEEGRPLQERLWNEGNQTNFYKVTYLDFPWPLGNRWLLTKEEDTVNGQSYYRHFHKVAGTLVRSEGKWLVRPYPDNPEWSYVRYDLTADGGIYVPHFVYKRMAPREVRKMLLAIRRRAEGLQSRLDTAGASK